MSEFARPVRTDTVGATPRTVDLSADAAERIALAARFGLLAIDNVEATVALTRDGDAVRAAGRLIADVVQACVATGAPVPAAIDEPFALRFLPAGDAAGGEVELDAADLDTMAYTNGVVDLGEAIAQTLALALDPFPRAPDAEDALRAAGVLTEEEAAAVGRADGPFAALAALKRD